ncbi:hypothetical protein LADH09A_002873 [Micromonospora sp. LAH09]|uniref:hypothetical protein n=1 Tax=Micromonospora cabrerizensis TaxID=2911213 RepID=UPI001EE82630|nr:hypothetical protein [Micromonospora cabrerizensis]MCG5468972.1 hypothetical protein [Micromonospora cabrerizensis]
MGSRRHIVLLITGLLIAALAFVVLRWDSAGRFATAASALAGIAGVGVALWAALPAVRSGVRARGTGATRARGSGYANSGIDAPAGDTTPMEVSRTGDATAADGGQAISGIVRRPR